MNSPFMGDFEVTQPYIPGIHDGLDLIAKGSDKNVHSCSNGTVIYAYWENDKNDKQGFGQYVAVQDDIAGSDGIKKVRYYGHLNSINVKVGQKVKTTDVLGEMGSTGYSTGPHCHYEIRSAHFKGAKVYNVSEISGIPNKLGIYNDGYKPKTEAEKVAKKIEVILDIEGHKYSGLLEEK